MGCPAAARSVPSRFRHAPSDLRPRRDIQRPGPHIGECPRPAPSEDGLQKPLAERYRRALGRKRAPRIARSLRRLQRASPSAHAPALIGLGRRVELLAPGRGDALADAAPHDEPLLAVEAVDQLVIDGPALAPELLVQHPVAVARSLRRQLAEVLAQLRVLHPLAAVPTGRACQLDDAAGAPLADTEVRLEKTRSLAACGGRHHFFALIAFSIWLSRVRSATMCFSRRFSSSSPFSLRASLTSMPPYLLRQR